MKSLTPSQKRAVAEKLIAAAEKEEVLAAFSDEWDNLVDFSPCLKTGDS